MKTRPFLQRRTNSESGDRLVATIQLRSWDDASLHHQAAQLQSTRHDFSHVDLFAHDPGSRSVPQAIQAKLAVGAPNDVYEREADHVAEQVMSTPDSAVQQPIQREMALDKEEPIQAKQIQREVAPNEENEAEPVQGKLIQREAALAEDEESESVQAKSVPRQKKSPASFQAQSGSEQQLDSVQNIVIHRLEQPTSNSFSEVLQCKKDEKANSIIAKAQDETQPIDKRAIQAVMDIVNGYWDASKVKEVVYRESEPGLSTTPIGKDEAIKGKIYVGSYFINNIDRSFARRVLQVGHELQHVDQQRAGMGGENNKNKREFLAFYWEGLAEEKEGTGRMSHTTRRELIDAALGHFYCLSTNEQKSFSTKKDELLKKRNEINTKGGNDPTDPPTGCK